MLAGKRAAVAHHQIRGAFDELAVFANSLFALQIETDAHVNAAVPKMPVERGVIIVFVQQLPDVAQIIRPIFPARTAASSHPSHSAAVPGAAAAARGPDSRNFQTWRDSALV